MKVTRVAHSNLPTAHALVSTSGPINITLGVLVSALPILLMAIESVALQLFLRLSSQVARVATLVIIAITVALSAFVVPLFFSVLLLILPAVSAVSGWLPKFLHGRTRTKQRTEAQVVADAWPQLDSVNSELERMGQDIEETLVPAESEDVDGATEDKLIAWEKRLAIAEATVAKAKALRQQLQSHQDYLDAKRAKLEDTERAIFCVGVVLIFAPVLFFSLGSSAVWLPPEHLTMTDGTSEIGYTLNSNSEWHSVLLEEDRRVVHFSPDRVLERTLCSLEDRALPRSLADYLSGQDRANPYPNCASIDD